MLTYRFQITTCH